MIVTFILTLYFGYKCSLLHRFFFPYFLPHIKIQAYTNNNKQKRNKEYFMMMQISKVLMRKIYLSFTMQKTAKFKQHRFRHTREFMSSDNK